MIITRDFGLPGWLAPKVAFDVAEERVAEDSILQQEQVAIGYGWVWDRPRNLLLHISQWTGAVSGLGAQQRQPLRLLPAQSLVRPFDDWLDDVLMRFTSVRFS